MGAKKVRGNQEDDVSRYRMTLRKRGVMKIERGSTRQQGPPLWSSGQNFWLQIQRSRVRFPALPDFLSSSGSGTGSTQPREVN